MKNKDRLLILSIFIITCCLGLSLRFTFQQGEYNVQQQIQQSLLATITKDYQERLLKEGIVLPKFLGRKIKGTKIMIGDNVENIIFKDSMNEQIACLLVDQYMLAQFTPIIPNDFNAIFKEELKQQGILDKAGIIYRHNSIPLYSDNDSISPSSACRTHIKMLDIKSTVSVQGWVDYSWKTLIKHTDTKSLWIIFSCYIASLALIFYKKKKTKNIKTPTIEKENLNYCEVGKIKLDLDKKLMYIDGKKCSINNMDFDLLRMFLETSEHYLSRENIKQTFWPKQDNSDDKINSHISILRRVLKDLEGYELVTIKGKGYRLDIPLP